MGKKIQGIGFGVPIELLEQLDAYAMAKGVSRSEAARAALAVGLPMLNFDVALNAKRALTILEHTQLALSTIIDRQYPELGTGLIEEAIQNVREHHG